MTIDTAAVRQFIRHHFDDDDFEALAFDFFPDVANNFTSGMTYAHKIQLLLKYTSRQSDRWRRLLGALERMRPDPYRQDLARQAAPPPLAAMETTASESLSGRNPRQIFLSHAHQDVDMARQLAADLQAEGWTIWLAPDSIRPGEMWAEAIDRGLAESAVFLLLLSQPAVDSKWVRRETYMAIEMDHNDELRFLPLLFQSCKAPAMWRSFQSLDFTGRYEPALAALLSTLSGRVAGPAPPPPRQERPSGRRKAPAPLSPIDILTPRQLEVLKLLAKGMSNQQIAAKLGISAATVSWHLRNICDRLNLADRTQVALYAVEQGLAGRRRKPAPPKQ